MMKWREYKFSDILIDGRISYGIVQPGSHTDETDSVPIVRVNNIKNGIIKTDDVLKVSSEIERKYQRTRLVGGELLITVVGTVGECAIVPPSLNGWNVARAVSVARIKGEFDKRFVKYCFKYEDVKFQMYGNTNDTVQPTLNLSSLKGIILSLPPLPEQKAIAAVLSSLDDKIDLLHRQNKTLEAMAETLFREWFVENVGEDWGEGTLGDLVELHYGKALKKSSRSGNGFPVIGSSGIVDYHSNYLVDAPGIVIGRKGTLGKTIYLTDNFYPIDTTYFVKPKSPDIGFLFLYFLLNSMNFKEMNSDSAVPGLNRDIALSVEIRIPSTKIIRKFNELVAAQFNKINKNNSQIQTLTQLRDTLLPKLMSGEVRVKI